jgi:hypothetical protein
LHAVLSQFQARKWVTKGELGTQKIGNLVTDQAVKENSKFINLPINSASLSRRDRHSPSR